MTPAIKQASEAGIEFSIHEYQHDPSSDSYGLEAAYKLGISEARVYKTLVVKLVTNELAVGIVPVSSTLNMKLIASALGVKKAALADAADVERSTAYVLGGVSPLGQKQKLKTVIDASASNHPTIYVSAGRRGLEIELSPQDLVALTRGLFAQISQTKT